MSEIYRPETVELLRQRFPAVPVLAIADRVAAKYRAGTVRNPDALLKDIVANHAKRLGLPDMGEPSGTYGAFRMAVTVSAVSASLTPAQVADILEDNAFRFTVDDPGLALEISRLRQWADSWSKAFSPVEPKRAVVRNATETGRPDENGGSEVSQVKPADVSRS